MKHSDLYELSEHWRYGEFLPCDNYERAMLSAEFEKKFVHDLYTVGANDSSLRYFKVVVPALGLNADTVGRKLIEVYLNFLTEFTEADWEKMDLGGTLASWVSFFVLFAENVPSFGEYFGAFIEPTNTGHALVALAIQKGIFEDAFEVDLSMRSVFTSASFILLYGKGCSPSWLKLNANALTQFSRYPANLLYLRECGLLKSEHHLEEIRSFEQWYAGDRSRIDEYMVRLVKFVQSRETVLVDPFD